MRTKQLLIFFALWLVFAVALQSAIVAFGFTRFFVTALMWSVAVAAMLALKLTGQPLKNLGWSWGPARYHWIALLLPLVYAGIAYGGAAAAGLIEFAAPTSQSAITDSIGLGSLPPMLGFIAAVLIIGTIGMVQSMSTGLGEEIGWRGFLTPRLTALSGFIVATFITGLIWSSWHVPMLVLSDYNGGGDQRFEIASFMILVIAISGAFAWLRLSSGSLWPAATLHASHNLFIQGIFDPLTTRGPNPITMVSEFGVILAASAVVVCIPFWVMGARISRERAAEQSV
jgi:membrane protease YdiL (CAAX protease family)